MCKLLIIKTIQIKFNFFFLIKILKWLPQIDLIFFIDTKYEKKPEIFLY